jgi:hypothetical protein
MTAAVTWLTFAGAVAVIVADEIPGVSGWALRVAAIIATAISIIRRVEPVIPERRGVLPPE